METWREGVAAVTCDGRQFHKRAATGNALSPTADS